MAVRRSATRGLFVVLSWGAGCQLVSGLPDDLSLGTGGGGAAPIVCVREDAPEAPAAQDVGGAEGFVVALRAIDVEKEADGQLPGLNLDGLCSCTEDERACRSLDASSGKGFCDDGSGRDAGSNAFFGALAYMLDPEGMSRYLSKLVEGGAWTLLLRVQGYSGTDDDDQVEVAWYGSLGLSASPQWQGADAWPIRSEFVAPSPEDPHAPTFKDPAAYVTGGKLVARLPVASLPIEGGSLGAMRMELSSVVLVARIEKVSGGRYHLRDGRIGAKVPVPELFATFASFRGANGTTLCTNAPLYPATRQIACRAVDAMLGAPEKDTPCDALSFGLDFEADAAALGSVMEPPPMPAGCPMETDPTFDVCDNL